MSGTILVGSLAVVSGILCFLFWKLDDNDAKSRFPLQVIVLGFLLGTIILLGKAAVDYNDNCSWLVDNSTVSGATTSYSYSYQCDTNSNNTSRIFYGVTVWISRIIAIYLFLTFSLQIFEYFKWRKKGGGQ